MKRVILHIGYPKTGTTSIQDWLTENADQLEEQGVRYVRAGRYPLGSGSDHIQHVNLGLDLRGSKRANPKRGLVRDAAEEIARSSCQTYVISSENFASFKPDMIARLASELQGGGALDWTVIVYLRRQDQWTESLYSTRLRRNTLYSFDEYLEHSNLVSAAHFAPRMQEWEAVFGRESLVVRDFGQAVGVGIVQDFLACAGIATDGNLQTVHRNSTLDYRLLYLFHDLRVRWAASIGQTKQPFDTKGEPWGGKAFAALRQSASQNGWEDVRPVYFSPAERLAFLTPYFAGNIVLNDRYGLALPTRPEDIGPNTAERNWPHDLSELDRDEVNTILAETIKTLANSGRAAPADSPELGDPH